MMELMESAADIKNLDSRLDWGRNRKISWSVVGYVTIIHIGAAFAFLPAMFSWSALGTAIVLHIFSGCFGLFLSGFGLFLGGFGLFLGGFGQCLVLDCFFCGL